MPSRRVCAYQDVRWARMRRPRECSAYRRRLSSSAFPSSSSSSPSTSSATGCATRPIPMAEAPILSVQGLKTYYHQDEGIVRAVDGASFDLYPGRTLGIVGESGCGKSVSARSILQIVQRPGRIDAGSILLQRNGAGAMVDLARLDPKGREMRAVRGAEIALVFQEPMTSLSAFYTVGNQIGEVIRLHMGLDKKAAHKRAIELLAMVGIPRPERRVDEYPFELSRRPPQ